jgi:hypothetical protein
MRTILHINSQLPNSRGHALAYGKAHAESRSTAFNEATAGVTAWQRQPVQRVNITRIC